MATVEEAIKVVPSERQKKWQEMEFYGFIHYGINTYTEKEWGDGTEDPSIFNPTEVDTDQWAHQAVNAGMTGLLITAKHHDGFCLWPSKYTEYSVKNTPYKDDIVGALAKSCKKVGIKMGIYLSPWDRHDERYGTEEYNEYFVNQLTELLTNYGDIFCVWFDGACGEGENGIKQVYDWQRYYGVIRKLQPDAVINICGPDVRWCGNEAGHCRPAEWSVVPKSLQGNEKIAEESQKEDDATFREHIPSSDEDLGSRQRIKNVGELVWFPAEVDTSIRPGWFYRSSEDSQVKSVDKLLEIYLQSVGGNASLLLNLPPNKDGRIAEVDCKHLEELGKVIKEIMESDLTNEAERIEETLDGETVMTYTFDEEIMTNMYMIQEDISYSQRIEKFVVECLDAKGNWLTVDEGQCVGYKKIGIFSPMLTKSVRIRIKESRGQVHMKKVGILYHNKIQASMGKS